MIKFKNFTTTKSYFFIFKTKLVLTLQSQEHAFTSLNKSENKYIELDFHLLSRLFVIFFPHKVRLVNGKSETILLGDDTYPEIF